MKKVLSNNIATGVRQPYTQVTHEWYNDMITEASNALSRMAVGNSTTDFIVLFGCDNSDSPDADISAGAVFYNGEIYLCPAFVDATITNDIVGTITTAYDALDPLLFSDGNSYDVHQVKTIVWSDAVSGSGDIDYADLVYPSKQNSYTPTVSGGSGGTAAGTASAEYFIEHNTVTINVTITALVITGTPLSINITTPSGLFIGTNNNFSGSSVALLNNGTATRAICSVQFPESNGSTLIGIGSDAVLGLATFSAFTGGSMRFTIRLFRVAP